MGTTFGNRDLNRNWPVLSTHKQRFNGRAPCAQMVRCCYAGMAKSADASDLKSEEPKGSCGFKSHSRYGIIPAILAGFLCLQTLNAATGVKPLHGLLGVT